MRETGRHNNLEQLNLVFEQLLMSRLADRCRHCRCVSGSRSEKHCRLFSSNIFSWQMAPRGVILMQIHIYFLLVRLLLSTRSVFAGSSESSRWLRIYLVLAVKLQIHKYSPLLCQKVALHFFQLLALVTFRSLLMHMNTRGVGSKKMAEKLKGKR